MTINNPEIVIIDYNTGNVDSIIKATKLFNPSVKLTSSYKVIENAKKIILPGQGSFNYGMEQLLNLGLVNLIKDKVINKKTPILGICLGMQILANSGIENKHTEGLGFIDGEIKRIPTKYKLPHIGWNEVSFTNTNKRFSNIENDKDFYFVHSYYFECKNKENIIATSNYGFEFPSIIQKDNILGFQFHPEKSLKNGLKLISNFIENNA
jgi:imidazole glycerol-phosphate synthase subunit HisH